MALPKATKIPVKLSVPVNSVTLAASLGRVFEDPEVGPADWTPRLSVLSLDIETDPAARRLLAIGLHGCAASEVLLLTPTGRGCPDGARPFSCAVLSSGWTTTASTPAPPPRSRRLLDRRLRLPLPHRARTEEDGCPLTAVEGQPPERHAAAEGLRGWTWA